MASEECFTQPFTPCGLLQYNMEIFYSIDVSENQKTTDLLETIIAVEHNNLYPCELYPRISHLKRKLDQTSF